MSGKAVKKAPKRKAANAYKLPEPIQAGEILTDITKKQWLLGTSIGIGGFGEIYSAAPYTGKTTKDYPNVIKIEPHGNGPLFVEMHFYMRNAKRDEIDAWRRQKKFPTLGMPQYIGSGSHEYKNTKYRFVVMERYGTDLWKLFQENDRRFPEHTVYKVAFQIVNVLEYIHHKTYVHADIKGANLLLDLKTQNQVYLVDFGLASHYTTKDEYKYDPKKAHNGTIEYTSRDAHNGVSTMRGDFEILGYNMIQWLSGSLLWENNLSSPTEVQKQKEKAFENIDDFLKRSFNKIVPTVIAKYMKLLANLKYNDKPDYDKFRKILTDGLKDLNHKPDGELEFKTGHKSSPSPAKLKKTSHTKKENPRLRQIRNVKPQQVNLDDSNVSIVIDKKRGRLNDIKEIINDIDSDEEYDIKIVKKKRVRKATNSPGNTKRKPKTLVTNRRNAKASPLNDSASNSEPEEVITRGTRSRPGGTPVSKTKRVVVSDESKSEDDMFAM